MIYYVLAAWVIGIIGGFILAKLLERQNKYVGNIVVNKIGYPDDEKIVYSLEIDNDPKQLQFEKEVSFKVMIPEEESDRE